MGQNEGKHEQIYPWDSHDSGSYPDMAYLLSEAAQARYVLAAHYVKDCQRIVEIGGFKTPITKFLTTTPESVLVLDPKIEEFHADHLYGSPCRVDHIPAKFQQFDFNLEMYSYGLILLGCSIKYFSNEEDARNAEWSKLVGLIDSAEVTVLEFALDWALGRNTADALTRQTATRVKVCFDLDLTDSGGMDTAYNKRRFMVLQSNGGK